MTSGPSSWRAAHPNNGGAFMLLGWLAGVVLSASPANPRPISQADSVVAIYAQDWGRASDAMAKVILVAWHELAEAGGRVVARSCALTPLADERRLDVLRKEPGEYLYYRVVWAELRGLASSLIPSESHPVKGGVVLKEGIMAWREAASR